MAPPKYPYGKPPTPMGHTAPPVVEETSKFLAWPAAATQTPTETVCAEIFFKTNEWNLLTADDVAALTAVGKILEFLRASGEIFACCCRGHADIRASEAYNLRLSEQRATKVAQELSTWLPPRCAAWITTDPLGKHGAVANRGHWGLDRRVDVVVTRGPMRLEHPSVGFEAAADTAAEMVFVKDMERMEHDNGGKVMVWMRSELNELYREYTELRGSHGPPLTQAEHAAEFRHRVTAYVRVTYELRGASRVHRVSAEIFDAATNTPMFPREWVEAQTLLDTKGTSYLSSPPGSPVQVWRHLGPGQQAPAGAPTQTKAGGPTGLIGQPGDLYKKLRAGLPSITARVAQKVGAPPGAKRP